MNQKELMKRYMKELFGAAIAYMIVLIGSLIALKQFEFPKIWQIIISLSPVIPVTFVLIAIMHLMVHGDELQLRIHFLAISFSAATTGLFTFSYGFLENVGFPKFSTIFVLPLMIFIWGISSKYFEKRYQ